MQGKANTFKIKTIDLGDLSELEVWHDGAGFGSGWHLNYIEVRCEATGRVYYFPCGRWLDKKEDDGLTRRRLKVRGCAAAYCCVLQTEVCADELAHDACLRAVCPLAWY